MSEATLRVVVVLYRSRLRTLRALLEAIGRSAVDDAVVCVVVNRDDLREPRGLRRVRFSPRVALEVRHQENTAGVAGAYNLVLAGADPHDIVVLLDADGKMTPDYFAEVWARRAQMRAGLLFAAPQMYSGELRISPYHLDGMVPVPIRDQIDDQRPLSFESGIGVINSGLAGAAAAFRQVDGFSRDIGLDLSDVAWSLAAGRCQASLQLLPILHQHDLSIRSRGFSARRLRKYLVACWRLGLKRRDLYGGIRLAARGLRVLFPREGRA